MSRPFAAVESFLERILERPAARLFHAHPQPVQVERRIERAMGSSRKVSGDQTYVSSRYRVLLHPTDLAALTDSTAELTTALRDAILQRARAQGYWLLSRPEVALIPSGRVVQGDLEVEAEPLDPVLVRSAAAGLRPVGLEGPRPPRPPIPGIGVVPDPVGSVGPQHAPDAQPLHQPVPMGLDGLPRMPLLAPAVVSPMGAMPQGVADSPVDASVGTFGGGVEEDVHVYPVEPLVERPVEPLVLDGDSAATDGAVLDAATTVIALIDVATATGESWSMPFQGGSVRVGRGADNEITLLDERVSRHHGRFTAVHGTLVYTDLDSTNGSLVNGMRVREIALGGGDVVRLGRTTLTIRPHV